MVKQALLYCSLLALTAPVLSLPTGAPCTTQPPHGSQASGPAPYKIKVSGPCYVPGASLLITLRADNGTNFKGFVMQSRTEDGERAGEFTGTSPDWKLNCDTPDSITHKNPSQKKVVKASWTAPGNAVGKIQFVATVAEGPSKWWFEGVKSESLPPCNNAEQSESRPEGAPAAVPVAPPAELEPQAPLPAPSEPVLPNPSAPVLPSAPSEPESAPAAAAAANSTSAAAAPSSGENSTAIEGQNNPSIAAKGSSAPVGARGSADQRCQSQSPSDKAAQTGCGGDWVTRYYLKGNRCVFTWFDKSCGEPDNYFTDRLLCQRICLGQA